MKNISSIIILVFIWIYPFFKTNYALGNSSEKYAIEAAYGIGILFNLIYILFFQSLPFSIVYLVFKAKFFKTISIYPKRYILGLIFLIGGCTASLLSRHTAYFVLPISYFMDLSIVSIYIIIKPRINFFTRFTFIQLSLLISFFIFSFILYKSKYPERIIELLLDSERYTCDRDHNSGLFNLYDNLEGKEILSYISDGCIWYYPSIDIARIYRGNQLMLLSIKKNQYLNDIQAIDIGKYSDGLFRIETIQCEIFPSKYEGSHREFCKTGYLLPNGDWKIRPKYFLANDFNNGTAKVGIVPSGNPTGFQFLCIDKQDRILRKVEATESCEN